MAATTVLLVDWKEEPLSPIFADELTLVPPDDTPLYWTNVEQYEEDQLKHKDVIVSDGDSPLDETIEDVEIGSDLLDNFKFEEIANLSEWIKEESSSFPWFEDQNFYAEINQSGSTQTLLQEFQIVLESVNTSGTLTPPQSPPYEQSPPLITLEPLSSHSFPKEEPQQYSDLSFSVPSSTPQTIAHELAVVDEIIRTRVHDILCEPPSPSTSNSIDDSSSCSEDPEWIPESVEELKDGKTKQRYKPYRRVNPDDKKSRKKEQNKNAATRYRMKKKAEVEVILTEEKEMQQDNDKLTDQISDLQREIRYLKGLMRDLFKAKGLIQ